MLKKEVCDRSYQRLERILKELVLHLADQLSRADDKELSESEAQRISAFGPLEMITYLKHELAALIAVRTQAKSDKNSQLAQIQEYERRVQYLETELDEAQDEISELRSRLETASLELRQTSNSREQLASSSKQALDQMKADNGSLLELITSRENTIEDLKMQIDSLKQLVASQEEQMKKIPVMEEQVKEFTRRYASDMSRSEARHKSDLHQSDKELKAHKKTLAVNTQYEEKIKQLTLELESFRRKFRKQIDSEQRAIRLAEVAADRNKTIQKLEIECNRLKVQLEARSQEIERLKSNLETANKQIEELREKPKEPTVAELRVEAIDNNPMRVEYYRRKVKEKKAEIVQLQKRLQAMYEVEKRYKKSENRMMDEREKFADRIAAFAHREEALKLQLANSKSEDKYALKKDGIVVSDFENVRELAKSTSDAYATLLEKFKRMKSEEEEKGLQSTRFSMTTVRSTRPTTADATGRKSFMRVSSAKGSRQ